MQPVEIHREARRHLVCANKNEGADPCGSMQAQRRRPDVSMPATVRAREIKALSGEESGAPAIAAGIGGGEAAAGRGTERGTARRPDGGSAERFEHF
ncbi:MAG: hypothetical protein LBU32_32500, partial [Clostridiales bacterium]|nr:hypothetical protein [Clostridiales bacterium]